MLVSSEREREGSLIPFSSNKPPSVIPDREGKGIFSSNPKRMWCLKPPTFLEFQLTDLQVLLPILCQGRLQPYICSPSLRPHCLMVCEHDAPPLEAASCHKLTDICVLTSHLSCFLGDREKQRY
ncbi:unnamed protein product [Eretmochelys imbricata]